MYYKFRNQTHNNCLTFNELILYSFHMKNIKYIFRYIIKSYKKDIYKKFKKNNNLNKNNNLIILTKYK